MYILEKKYILSGLNKLYARKNQIQILENGSCGW